MKKARRQYLTPVPAAEKGIGRFKCNFTEGQNHELLQYVVLLEERLFSLSPCVSLGHLRERVFPEKNILPLTFHSNKRMDVKERLYGFLHRQKHLSVR